MINLVNGVMNYLINIMSGMIDRTLGELEGYASDETWVLVWFSKDNQMELDCCKYYNQALELRKEYRNVMAAECHLEVLHREDWLRY